MPATSPAQCDTLIGQAISAGDLEAIMALYEPGATFISDDGQRFTGTDAIREAMSGLPDGVQVSDSKDIPDAIRQAQASGLPSVIDIVIDRGPSPDDWRADARRAGET